MTDLEEIPEDFSGSMATVFRNNGKDVATVQTWDFVLSDKEKQEAEKLIRRRHGKSCTIIWRVHD